MNSKVTINGIATLLNKDRRAVDKAVKETGLEPIAKDSKGFDLYKIDEIVDAIYESKVLNLTNERAELTRQQKLKTELEVQRLQGSLIDVEDVEQDASNTAVLVKNTLLQFPSRVSAMLAVTSDIKEIETLLDREIRDALNEISRSIFVDEEHMEQDTSEVSES